VVRNEGESSGKEELPELEQAAAAVAKLEGAKWLRSAPRAHVTRGGTDSGLATFRVGLGAGQEAPVMPEGIALVDRPSC
jgi:hypothetical protein